MADGRHLGKIKNRHISAIVWPIATKFSMAMQSDRPSLPLRPLKFRNFKKSKMAAAAILNKSSAVAEMGGRVVIPLRTIFGLQPSRRNITVLCALSCWWYTIWNSINFIVLNILIYSAKFLHLTHEIIHLRYHTSLLHVVYYLQEGQHPLTGQRAVNFRLLANQ